VTRGTGRGDEDGEHCQDADHDPGPEEPPAPAAEEDGPGDERQDGDGRQRQELVRVEGHARRPVVRTAAEHEVAQPGV
jgi:hypothetical protein